MYAGTSRFIPGRSSIECLDLSPRRGASGDQAAVPLDHVSKGNLGDAPDERSLEANVQSSEDDLSTVRASGARIGSDRPVVMDDEVEKKDMGLRNGLNDMTRIDVEVDVLRDDVELRTIASHRNGS